MADVLYYKGKYLQGSLTDDEAEAILRLRNEYSSVTSLKHCIKDVPQHVVMDIIKDHEEYENEYGSLRGFNKDYSKLIKIGTLRDEQTIGVAFMYFAGSALLGDSVGLGKTVQIAGLVNVLKDEATKQGRTFRYCFLTEKTNIGQIRDKMIQFTGEFVGMLESGEKAVVERYIERNTDKKYYSIVGGHSLLTSSEFLVYCAKHPFDLIIVDESSILKTTGTEYHTNAKSLFKYIKRKILLNATPLETELRDFYNQLALLDKGYMPTVAEFERRFCKKSKGLFGYHVSGYKNHEEFKELISLRYLARTRQDSGGQFTGNHYKVVLVPLSDEQKKLMRKTTLYSMVSDYPSGVDRRIEFNPTTTPKVSALLKILSEIDVATGKALIYCRFVDCQEKIKDLLTQHGYKCVVLNGKVRTKERYRIVEQFNSGIYDIMITNVQKGLDLKNCDNCILYTIDPNPQKMVQVEGRITRELDIEYKSVFLLVSMGKEKKFVEEVLKLRVEASKAFVNTGRSMVVDALSSGENRELLE